MQINAHEKKKRRYRLVAFIFLMTGISVMLYPLIATWMNNLEQTEIVDGYISKSKKATESDKLESIEAAEKYNEKLKNNGIVMTDPFDEAAVKLTSEEYYQCLNVDGKGMMAYIDIPSIKVHLPIYHTTSSDVLTKAVGHLQGSSLPVGGEDTHCVLSAHTGVADQRLFTDLVNLEVGDFFTITIYDKALTYQVYDIEIVLPEQTESLMIQDGKDLCTLVTCTPYGINTHRLLVHGRRSETSADIPKDRQDISKNTVFLWVIIAILTFVVILLIIVNLKGIVCFRYNTHNKKENERLHRRTGK